MSRFLGSLLKKIYYLGALLIILLAILVQAGRLCIAYLDDFREPIQGYLGEQLGVNVSLGNIEARWKGLRPEIYIEDLLVTGRVGSGFAGQTLVSATAMGLVFDLSDTLAYRTPVFKKVGFNDLQLNLVQAPGGVWKAAGFKAPANSPAASEWRYRNPADLFQTVQFGDLNNTRLMFNFSDGRVLDVDIPNIDIQNKGEQHVLSASLDIDGKDVVSLSVNGQGDPYKLETFSARAYLELDQLPVEKLSDFIAWQGKDRNAGSRVLPEADLDSRLWFYFDSPHSFSLSGNLAVKPRQAATAVAWPPAASDLFQYPVSAQLGGKVETASVNENGISARIFVSELDIGQQLSLAPANVEWNKDAVKLRLESLDIASLSGWFESRLADDNIKNILDTLSPSGKVSKLELDIPLQNIAETRLAASVNNISVDSWKKLPDYKNISGYLETGLRGGSLLLDTRDFALGIPTLFDSPLVFDRAKGQLDWSWKEGSQKIILAARDIVGNSELGESRGNLQLNLPLKPSSGQTYDQSGIALQLGLQKSRLEKLPMLLPKVLNREVADWLKTALKQGSVDKAGLLYRGSLVKGGGGTFQLFADVSNTVFAYQPEWPQLNNVGASVMVDNNVVTATINEAGLYQDVSVSGKALFNDRGEQLLHIDLDVTADGESSLRFVENSPLNNIAGDVVADWRLEGDVDYRVELVFPLGRKGQASQKVRATLDNNSLEMSDLKLRFDKLQGDFYYSTEEGFYTKSLLSDFMGDQLVVDLETVDNSLDFSGVGKVDTGSVFDWLEQPLFKEFVDGRVNYSFDLAINTGAPAAAENNAAQPRATLSVYSDLKNAAIDMPGQFKKYPAAATDFLLEGRIFADKSDYQIRLGDNIFASINLAAGGGFSSLINIDELAAPETLLAELPGLQIKGRFSSLDIEEWLPFFTSLIDYPSTDDADPLPIAYDLEAQLVNYDELLFTNVSVLGRGEGVLWQNTLASDSFAGNVFYNGEVEFPINIDLDYLLWAGSDEKADDKTAKVDPWQDFDFTSLLPMQTHIAYLEYDKKPLGEWSFNTIPRGQGVTLNNINAVYEDISISGLDEQQGGAILAWQKASNGSHSTSINGKIRGGNLKSLFEEWDLPPVLENQQLDADIRLSWAGTPVFFDVNRSTGKLGFELENGRFIQQETNATAGVLQLVNLVNFDAWLRRLRFDFSDISSNSVAFDTLAGEISLDQGLLAFSEPVEVESTSLSLALRGEVDNRQETIDGELDVVLPVGGNLNFAAALVAGLPAAVGVYLVRKLFQSEIEKASTLTYEVSGGLDKPDIKFKASSVDEAS